MCVTALLIGLFVARPLITRMFAPSAAAVLARSAPSPVAGALPAPARSPAPAGRANARLQRSPRPAPSCIDISRIEGQVREFLHQERSVKWSKRILKKRWRSSAPGCINRYNPCQKPPKPPSKKISGRSPAPSAPPSSCCRLGEEHSAKIWRMMDEEEIKEVSQVMSNLGSVSSSLDRKAAGRFRLARCRAPAR